MPIFDDGNLYFSEDETFLLSDWLAHTTKGEKYIFRGATPDTSSPGLPSDVTKSKHRITHRLFAQPPFKSPGGTVRIADISNFPVSTTIAAAHVTIEPHGLGPAGAALAPKC
ncbi:hypothetical protein M405DRAFT_921208 [Rhizopogon salebrosus TDB-379]|nr:hypothetical protein M405DRAFT_921208 [Rhizopogon salebrosus TDB-379]